MFSTKSLSDHELVDLLKKDDELAFEAIYKRYAEALSGFASSKLYSIEDSRDVTHDLFIKLWEERHHLVVTGNLKSYLFAAIRYRIIDKIRKNITREEYSAMVQSLDDNRTASFEQQLDAKELQQTINSALDSLTPKTRKIYQLSRVEHKTIAEIASLLEISEQTVKNQLTIALNHLRATLGRSAIISLLILWWLK
jgi:RNA polymerase sigma-70 factor (family 1)